MDPITEATFKGQKLLTKKPTRIVDYKIVLLGESSVGKSSILERLQNNSFNDNKSSTIGAAFISKKIIRNETDLINLQIWDTAGQERFHNLTPLYYRNSNAAIIVFDLTNFESFKKAEYWIKQLDTYIEELNTEDDTNGNRNHRGMKIILVGNKLDLLPDDNCLFGDAISEFLSTHKEVDRYFKSSAKNNIQIGEIFEYITNSIDPSLFEDIEQNDRTKKGLVDLEFGNNQPASSTSCSC